MTETQTFAQTVHAANKAHRATRALQRLIEKSPGSGSLSLWVRHEDSEPLSYMPWCPAWTNGKKVWYAPAFEKYTLDEKVGVAAHELLHVAFRHSARRATLRREIGHVDGYIYNIAADAIINQVLLGHQWLKLPKNCVVLCELLKEVLGEDWEPKKALSYWTTETLYRALVNKLPKPITIIVGYGSDRKENQDARSPNERVRAYAESKNFKEDIPESQDSDDHNPAREAEESRAWQQRLARAQAGDGSRGLLRDVIADLPVSKTPWEHILRSRAAAALQRKVRTTWSRPSRRYLALADTLRARGYDMPYQPGIDRSAPAMRMVAICDTSASMEDDLLRRVGGEMCGIQNRTGAHLTVIVADDRIHGEWELKARSGRRDLGPVKFLGHGGTDFDPALARAIELKADFIVYFTDLEGPATIKPKCPIIWAVPRTPGCVQEAPFGQLLLLD